jgi:hypothetical protein
VVAITTLGLDEHQMRPATAVALVTAALLSVLVFPTVALLLRRPKEPVAAPAAEVELA